jgi:hypothetical protein
MNVSLAEVAAEVATASLLADLNIEKADLIVKCANISKLQLKVDKERHELHKCGQSLHESNIQVKKAKSKHRLLKTYNIRDCSRSEYLCGTLANNCIIASLKDQIQCHVVKRLNIDLRKAQQQLLDSQVEIAHMKSRLIIMSALDKYSQQ